MSRGRGKMMNFFIDNYIQLQGTQKSINQIGHIPKPFQQDEAAKSKR